MMIEVHKDCVFSSIHFLNGIGSVLRCFNPLVLFCILFIVLYNLHAVKLS